MTSAAAVASGVSRRQGHTFDAQRSYAGPDSGMVAYQCGVCNAQLVVNAETGAAGGWAAARSCAALVAEREAREADETARAVRWTKHQAAEARKARVKAMEQKVKSGAPKR